MEERIVGRSRTGYLLPSLSNNNVTFSAQANTNKLSRALSLQTFDLRKSAFV